MRFRRGCRGWPLMALAFIADRLTKAAVQTASLPRELLPGLLRCRPVRNSGVAFSMLSGGGWPVIAGTALVIAGVLAWLLLRPDEPKLTRAGLWLIAGGGLGNLFDRLACGAVIDFLELEFVRFAIFNVADVCVCVGAGMAALGMIVAENAKKERGHGDI